MKKMYLIKNQQYGVISYVGSVDPRVLVRLADQSIEIGQVQDCLLYTSPSPRDRG